MPKTVRTLDECRLLFLNWRDPGHPLAGGAEIYCMEIAQRLAIRGAKITLFSAKYPNAADREVSNSIEIRRAGGTYSLYLYALIHVLKNRKKYDAIVDFQNGIPFFSPLVTPSAVVLTMFHVHQEQFKIHFKWPLNQIGKIAEGPFTRQVYRHIPIVAISATTRQNIRTQLKLDEPIFIIPCGTDATKATIKSIKERTAYPTIVCVTRLVPHKQIDILLGTLQLLKNRYHNLKLHIVGDGPLRERLEGTAKQLEISDIVTFYGKVSEGTKDKLVSSSWLAANPSNAEGWSLTVMEAALSGVPTVAFDVPGLRDSIIDGKTGWLVKETGTKRTDAVTGLANAIDDALQKLKDPLTAKVWGERCHKWARQFTWENSATKFGQVIIAEINRKKLGIKERRKVADNATVVTFSSPNPDATVLQLENFVRSTDSWARDTNRFSLFLYSCDDTEAYGVLRRLGPVHDITTRPAHIVDLLLGAKMSETKSPT